MLYSLAGDTREVGYMGVNTSLCYLPGIALNNLLNFSELQLFFSEDDNSTSAS